MRRLFSCHGFRAPCFTRPRNDVAWFFALLRLLVVALPTKAAGDVAGFYRGRRIRFVVGSAAGGTYDLLAGIVAGHVVAHIPGKPSIIEQNQGALNER